MSGTATLFAPQCGTVDGHLSREDETTLSPTNVADNDRRESDYEALVRDHSRVIAAAVRRVCAGRYAALIPDVEQEIHVALWRRLKSGKEIRSPASYLYKVALTTALAVIRRQHPEQETSLSSLSPAEGAQVEGGRAAEEGDRLQPVERARLLEECLDMLKEDQARAVRAYLAGFNHVEVAHLYGWSESVARHKIYRGIEALKRRFGQETN